MNEYSVYLIAYKNLKFKTTVQTSSLSIASEIALNRARAYKDADWSVSMIWYNHPKNALC